MKLNIVFLLLALTGTHTSAQNLRQLQSVQGGESNATDAPYEDSSEEEAEVITTPEPKIAEADPTQVAVRETPARPVKKPVMKPPKPSGVRGEVDTCECCKLKELETQLRVAALTACGSGGKACNNVLCMADDAIDDLYEGTDCFEESDDSKGKKKKAAKTKVARRVSVRRTVRRRMGKNCPVPPSHCFEMIMPLNTGCEWTLTAGPVGIRDNLDSVKMKFKTKRPLAEVVDGLPEPNLIDYLELEDLELQFMAAGGEPMWGDVIKRNNNPQKLDFYGDIAKLRVKASLALDGSELMDFKNFQEGVQDFPWTSPAGKSVFRLEASEDRVMVDAYSNAGEAVAKHQQLLCNPRLMKKKIVQQCR